MCFGTVRRVSDLGVEGGVCLSSLSSDKTTKCPKCRRISNENVTCRRIDRDKACVHMAGKEIWVKQIVGISTDDMNTVRRDCLS